MAERFLKPFPVLISRMCTSKGPSVADWMKCAVTCIGSGCGVDAWYLTAASTIRPKAYPNHHSTSESSIRAQVNGHPYHHVERFKHDRNSVKRVVVNKLCGTYVTTLHSESTTPRYTVVESSVLYANSALMA